MTNEERIIAVADKIDKQMENLDVMLDDRLEKHEKDFLQAYRFHMLKVQEELTTLKQRANEAQLKAKQEEKIQNLETQIAKFRNDCTNIMKYCSMQKQLIADFSLRKRELREDEEFLETEVAESKVQKHKLKLAISKTHNECETQNF